MAFGAEIDYGQIVKIFTTPAVAAGVSDHIWTISELIDNAAGCLPEPSMVL